MLRITISSKRNKQEKDSHRLKRTPPVFFYGATHGRLSGEAGEDPAGSTRSSASPAGSAVALTTDAAGDAENKTKHPAAQLWAKAPAACGVACENTQHSKTFLTNSSWTSLQAAR